ncbi:MAG: glycosyltransferase [Psychroserpens sp.]|uniref:glycosyltransferase family 2 protein n=1 Tax=Psychroserpens sp. TaxID=2020870 RepID=UPI003C74E969
MKPFFSVVISVYNKELFISKTLNSVLNQTFKDFEVIIINDGSTDQSLDILNAFEDQRITIISQENAGASQARNTGMAVAKGVFIALLDGDDLWEPLFLESIHELTKKHPSYSVFGAAIAHKHEQKITPVPYSFEHFKDERILDYFKASKRHTILSGSSTIFRKDILKKTGNFDTTIASGQDTDLWIRIGLNYPIVFLNTVLVYYVQNEHSLSNITTDVNAKSKLDKYLEEEKTNSDLKIFMDNNRFSLAILGRLNHNERAYNYYKSGISQQHLSLKRRILLNAPKWMIKLFLNFKKAKKEKTYFPVLEATKSPKSRM